MERDETRWLLLVMGRIDDVINVSATDWELRRRGGACIARAVPNRGSGGPDI